jgi:ribose-phosphate pyrophosphokinase
MSKRKASNARRRTPAESHPLVLFGGSHSRELAACVAEHLGIELGEADTSPFPNGESMVRIRTNIRSRDVFILQAICRRWLPTAEQPFTGVNDSLMELLLWVDAAARASAHRVTTVIPYFGYARQDRKATGRTPISARVVASCLEETGCNRVLALDIHNQAIQGFFSRRTILDHLNAGKLIVGHLRQLGLQDAVVLCPDVGNLKKADKYLRGMPVGVDIAVVDKRRANDGSVTAVRIVGDVRDRVVIVLDDIISTGTSARAAIDLALAAGAREFRIAATHGEFVGNAIEQLNHPAVKEICVTNSIPMLPEVQARLPITVLSVGELLADAVQRIHSGESVSELLGEYS